MFILPANTFVHVRLMYPKFNLSINSSWATLLAALAASDAQLQMQTRALSKKPREAKCNKIGDITHIYPLPHTLILYMIVLFKGVGFVCPVFLPMFCTKLFVGYFLCTLALEKKHQILV